MIGCRAALIFRSRLLTAAAARPAGTVHSPLNLDPSLRKEKHAHFTQYAIGPTNAMVC